MAAISLLLAVSAAGRSNLAFGQVSIIVVFLTIFDLANLRFSRWRGLMIGVAIAIKLTPLLFLPLLWFGGRRRQAISATATAFVVTAAAAIVNPAQSIRFWWQGLSDDSRFVNSWIPGNQSLRAVLERSGVHDKVLWLGLALAISVFSLAVGARLLERQHDLLAFGTVGVGTLMASPISWTHHRFWLIMPALWAVQRPRIMVRLVGILLLAVTLVEPASVPWVGPMLWPLLNLHALAAMFCLAGAGLVAVRGVDVTQRRMQVEAVATVELPRGRETTMPQVVLVPGIKTPL